MYSQHPAQCQKDGGHLMASKLGIINWSWSWTFLGIAGSLPLTSAMRKLIGEGLAFKATQTGAGRELGLQSLLLALRDTPCSLLVVFN